MSDLVVKVNGERFKGWKTATVKRSIEAISGAFDLSVTDEWGELASQWRINAGDAVVVELAGEPVVTGFVDKVSARLSATSREISVSGRDKAGDLVDCSVPTKPSQFKNQTLLQIAMALSKGVTFLVDGPDTPLATFATNPCETVFEALERAARKKGLLLTSDGRGFVTFSRPGVIPAMEALIEGKNILAATSEVDDSQRYAEYLIVGNEAPDGASWTSETSKATPVKATATDAGARGSRRLAIQAECSMTPAQAKDRAEWEATVRAARALKISVTVQGWTQVSGELWQINRLATLRAPHLGIEGRFLIAGVQFALGTNGTTTTLDLRRSDAFQPQPKVARKKRDQKVPGWGV